VVCKKHYIEVVLKELLHVGQPSAYIPATNDSSELIEKHIQCLRGWNIGIPSDMEQLPSMYWLPKLHKTPYGSRFIAASSKCSTRPLSGLLMTCLSHIMTQFKEYCNGIYRNTGINCFWIINNSQQVLQSLHLFNVNSKAVGFENFDFSTLYTSIPHDSLKCYYR